MRRAMAAVACGLVCLGTTRMAGAVGLLGFGPVGFGPVGCGGGMRGGGMWRGGMRGARGEEGGGLGDARSTDGGADRFAGVRDVYFGQRGRRERDKGPAAIGDRGQQAGLILLEVHGGDGADRGRGQVAGGQGLIDESVDLGGRDAAAGPEADDQGRRAVDDRGRGAVRPGAVRHGPVRPGPVGHDDRGDGGLGRAGDDGGRQRRQRPGRVGAERDPLAGQDRGAHRGQVAAGLDHEAQVGAEPVQGHRAGRVAGRGDHRLGPEHGGDPAGQVVGPARVRSRHRHGEAQGLVDADHPGVLVLVPQERGEQAHGGADGQEHHHRVRVTERCGQGGGGRAIVGPGLAGPGRGEAGGGGPARGGDRDQADHDAAPAGGGPGRSAQRTKTGLSAASRSEPPGSGDSREAWSWVPSVV